MTTTTIRAELDAAQSEPTAWTCPTCKGAGYYRVDESSYFACDCSHSVAASVTPHEPTDSHSDQAIDLYDEWADPDAHEELARDIDAHDMTHPGWNCLKCLDTGREPVYETNAADDWIPCTCGAYIPPAPTRYEFTPEEIARFDSVPF